MVLFSARLEHAMTMMDQGQVFQRWKSWKPNLATSLNVRIRKHSSFRLVLSKTCSFLAIFSFLTSFNFKAFSMFTRNFHTIFFSSGQLQAQSIISSQYSPFRPFGVNWLVSCFTEEEDATISVDGAAEINLQKVFTFLFHFSLTVSVFFSFPFTLDFKVHRPKTFPCFSFDKAQSPPFWNIIVVA